MGTLVKLRNVRLSFPDLFKATAFDPKQKPKFGAQFLLAKGDPQIAKVQAAIEAEAKALWGAKAPIMLKSLSSDQLCLRDGDLKSDKYEGYADCMCVVAKNPTKPSVFDLDGKTRLTEDSGRPYSGCYVNANIDVYALARVGAKPGVWASLQGVQFCGDGDAFTGGAVAQEGDFDNLADQGDEDDLTA
jgi:hypothetical protein